MTAITTWILAGLGGLFAVIGLVWFLGRGGGMMNGWNTMDKERKARYDEKAFLRFNGKVTLLMAALLAVGALLNHLGQTWVVWVAFSVALLGMVSANIYSMRSKKFIKKDAPDDTSASDPKKIRERKIKLIAGIVFTLVIAIPVGWLVMEGVRPINVSLSDTELRVRGIYGTAVAIEDILELTLEPYSMAEIGTGGRRMGHATTNNLRGSFGVGQLLITNPDEGPTIRIERRGDNALFISLADAADTIVLYEDIRRAIE